MTRRVLLRLIGLAALSPAKPLPLPEPIRPVPPLPVPMFDHEGAVRLRAWYGEAAVNPAFTRFVREAADDGRYYGVTG